MKKTIRLISILLVLALSLTLTGCTSDELSFLQAMEKMAKAKSYIATSELTTKITSNIPAEINNDGYSPINLKSVLNSFKNFKLTSNIAMSRDKDKVLGQVEYGVSSEDISFKTTAFIKTDGDNMFETFKIPTIFRWLLPADKMDAEYLTMDFSALSNFMKEKDTGMNFEIDGSKIPGQSDKLIDAYIKFQNEYAKKMPTAPSIIKKSGNTYNLSFTDASLKLFLRAIVDTYFKEADAKKAVDEFGKEIIAFYDGIYPGMLTDEIKASINEYTNNIIGNETQVDAIFKILDKLPILGEKGISINYSVDSKGYINKVDGFVDLYLDINKISALMQEEVSEEAFNIDILLNFKTEYNKINEPVTIAFPKLIEQNNINYVDILKSMEKAAADRMEAYKDTRAERVKPQLPAEDGSISIIKYGDVIDFGHYKPEIIDGTLYAPLDEVLDINCSWNSEENVAVLYNGDKKFWLFPGDSVIYGEDYSITLAKTTLDYKGQIYVPLKSFLASFTGQTITWNEEQNAAYIGWGY
jgi:hypothetical protein